MASGGDRAGGVFKGWGSHHQAKRGQFDESTQAEGTQSGHKETWAISVKGPKGEAGGWSRRGQQEVRTEGLSATLGSLPPRAESFT